MPFRIKFWCGICFCSGFWVFVVKSGAKIWIGGSWWYIFDAMKVKTSESVKLPISLIQYAKAHKKATGVAMSTFIEEAVNKQLNRLPKKIKAKMVEIDPTLCF